MLRGCQRRLGWIVRAAGLLGAIALVCLVLGTAIPRGDAQNADRPSALNDRRILLLAGPIHSDIAFPADAEMRGELDFLASAGLPLDRPDVGWILIGWGGRSFYTETPTWGDLRPLPVIRTLVGDESTLHVSLAGDIDSSHPDVKSLDLTQDAYEDLQAAVMGSFLRGADGVPIEIPGAGYGPFDRFYEANGSFHILNNCNGWTASMLRQAGVTTGFWTPLPQLLFLSLDLHRNDGPAKF